MKKEDEIIRHRMLHNFYNFAATFSDTPKFLDETASSSPGLIYTLINDEDYGAMDFPLLHINIFLQAIGGIR